MENMVISYNNIHPPQTEKNQSWIQYKFATTFNVIHAH